ncbi:MAG: GAF domain-containing protein [Cyclobacteriaceae bacterium]
MNAAPIPHNEETRLNALRNLNILNTERQEEFDALTEMVSQMIDVPFSALTLIDENTQYIKSEAGGGYGVKETRRDESFCQHTIMQDAIFEVNDALEHNLFKNSPFVVGGPKIRFYAGATLKSSDGFNLGALCVLDSKPRKLTDEHREVLCEYAKQVIQMIEN